jgi:autophagy-related protein 27
VPQSFNLTLLCAQDGGSDPTFVGYDNGVTRVEWNTVAGCPAKSSDGGDNSGGSGDGEDADSSSGSGIGWFFLLYVLLVFLRLPN